MLYAGIDIGSLTAEAVVIKNGRILASEQIGVLPNPVDSAKEVMGQLLEKNSLGWDKLDYVVSTGYGREAIQAEGLSQQNVSEISCHGYGAYCAAPRARTVVDIGGQDAKVIKVDENGDLDNFLMNDKCAAGTGHFLEHMSRALDVQLEELGTLALKAREPVKMSSRCTIFVETEVLHYQQRGVPKSDIAAGICKAMADRVVSMVRRIKPVPEIVMTGGVAKNIAVRGELERQLQVRMLSLKVDPQIVGAFGAARIAQRNGGAS